MSEKSQKKKTLWFVLTGIIGLVVCIGIYLSYQAHVRKAEESLQEANRIEREAREAQRIAQEKHAREMQEFLDKIEKRKAQKQAEQRNAKLKAEINLGKILFDVDIKISDAAMYQMKKEANGQTLNKFEDCFVNIYFEFTSSPDSSLQERLKLLARLAKLINGMSDEDQKNMSSKELQAAKNYVIAYTEFEKAYHDFTARYGEYNGGYTQLLSKGLL